MRAYSRNLLLGAALITCAVSAQAQSTTIEKTQSLTFTDGFASFSNNFTSAAVGKSFVDYYTFTLPSLFDASGDVTSRGKYSGTVALKDLDITMLALTGPNAYSTTWQQGQTGKDEYLPFDAVGLQSGKYTFAVYGTVKALVPNIGSVGYSGNMTLTPIVSAVPEPTTWGMLVCGLGLVGLAARRRDGDDSLGQADSKPVLNFA
jgi:hypothetical protein